MKTASRRKSVAILYDTSCKAGCERLAGAMDYIAQSTDWHPSLIPVTGRPAHEIRRELAHSAPLGIVIQCRTPPHTIPPRLGRTPVVTIDGYSWEWDFRPNVRIRLDENDIGKVAADFLHAHGFKSAAFIGSLTPAERIRSLARGRAFEKAFCDNGEECRIFQPKGTSDADDRSLVKFLSTLEKPSALLAYSDAEAVKVLTLCRQLRISVPKQLGILGVDNNEPICEGCSTTLSSIQPDFRSCGRSSVQALSRLLKRNVHARGAVITFGVQTIVERQSTRDIGAAHRLAHQICELIAGHFAEHLTADFFTSKTRQSVRTMEKAFRETMGHSIREELKLTRLRKAAEFLSRNKDSVSDIAWKTGLGSAVNLSILFKRKYGQSPTDWRKSHRS